MLINEAVRVSQAGEQRYRYLFENTPICIFVVDRTVTPAMIIDINRQAELIYGYTAAELVGNPAVDLVPVESRTSVENILQRVRQRETVRTETTARHRDSTLFPVRVIATLDPADRDRMLIVVEDISAERQRRSESEAIDRERLRIAHEIHDGVAQDLAGLRLKAMLWQQLGEMDSSGMHAALDEFQYKLNLAISDLRRAIFALRPADLEALGFFQALAQLVDGFGEYHQLVTQLEVSGLSDELPAAYELPLFRIIQEGLNNIHQHARASSVFVGLNVNAIGGVTVSVRDNGRGFYPNLVGRAGHSDRFGLRQMRERILELGGTLDIRSAIGQGTQLRITLPPIAKEANDI
jgi:PAS domain S-box-containing protein